MIESNTKYAFCENFRNFFARSSEFDAILFYERNVYFYDKDLPDVRDPREIKALEIVSI